MQALQKLCRSYAGVPAGHSSLPEPPSSCQTQTPPVPDKVGIFCLALQHGPDDSARAGNTESQGFICRRHSCLAVPARRWCPPAAPLGTAPHPVLSTRTQPQPSPRERPALSQQLRRWIFPSSLSVKSNPPIPLAPHRCNSVCSLFCHDNWETSYFVEPAEVERSDLATSDSLMSIRPLLGLHSKLLKSNKGRGNTGK